MKTKQQEQRGACRANSKELKAAYRRGARYLRQREKVAAKHPLPLDTRAVGRLCLFGDDPIGKQIVHRLANQLDINIEDLKLDAKFAEATEEIVGNCGELARTVLFDSMIPQNRKSIMMLSRKSRERQNLRINLVATGKSRTVRPQGTDRVPDTMDFDKILSRLERARGDFYWSGVVLAAGADMLSAESLHEIAKTTRKCQKALRQHVNRVAQLHPAESTGRVRNSEPKSTTRLTPEMVPGQLEGGISHVEKNVRDMPTSSYDLSPTRNQLKQAEAEVTRIREACHLILKLVATSPGP